MGNISLNTENDGINDHPTYIAQNNAQGTKRHFEKPVQEWIIEKLETNRIVYQDKRNQGGCLWIVGGYELEDFVRECKAHGYFLSFKSGGCKAFPNNDAWWTKDRLKPQLQIEMDFTSNGTLENTFEPSLLVILQGEQYAPLRSMLIQKNILTMCEFLQLNLWTFMNQNRLYSIGQRQNIYSTIRRALESVSTDEMYAQWKIVTRESEYIGICPADALLKYCQAVSAKYPLRFRKIIGMKMTGSELRPLMRTRLHDNDPHMSNPDVFIDVELAEAEAQKCAQWISASCDDDDTPQIINSVSPATTEKSININQEAVTKSVCLTESQSISLDAFRDFLLNDQHLSEKTAVIYRTSILKIEEYIKQNQLGFSLLTNDAEGAQKVFDQLMSRRDFVMFNDVRHRQLSAALVHFVTFLRKNNTATKSPKLAPVIMTPNISPANTPKVAELESLQAYVEKLVLEADLDGVTLGQLNTQIPDATMVSLKQVRDNSLNLVDMGGRIIHVNAFVDWEEAAEKLQEILKKLLTKNNGYVSSSQLWEYVRSEMHMFLNDNGITDERSVYYIARHLFEKVGWHEIHYSFTGGCHISRGGKETLNSNLDVINMFARENSGFFCYDDLVEYLEKVGLPTRNLRMQILNSNKPYYFYYSSDKLISSESMRIDDSWLEQAKKALSLLFADQGDHVVLRDINPIWYEQLPSLPGYIPWTALLLQYILKFYGEQLGAKTIGSELNQNYHVLHAMLVTRSSEVQTFADAVVAYLVDNAIEQREFEAEELRGVLVSGSLITGNELNLNLPKAIGSDPRFAWDMSGQKVKVKV